VASTPVAFRTIVQAAATDAPRCGLTDVQVLYCWMAASGIAHGGVAQHEHLETGISGGQECGDAHGVAGMLTPTALLAVVSVMCGKPGCLDRLRSAQLDAAALAMMSPVGITPPQLGWPGPCAPLRTVTTGPSRGAISA
jgi:hypothetical protein